MPSRARLDVWMLGLLGVGDELAVDHVGQASLQAASRLLTSLGLAQLASVVSPSFGVEPDLGDGGIDPATRLRKIAEETTRRKAANHPSLGTMFRSRLRSGVLLKFVARRRVNVLSADLPEPSEPLHFCGARILGVFPQLNLIGNVSLGVGAMSYAGRFCVLVVADADAHPDLAVFTDSARRELEALLRVTHGDISPVGA